MPTNFVFFFADQQRAESLSAFGNPTVSMPNFRRIAEEGTRFENCFTQSALCTPSRCSLVTGLYPHVHGHRSLLHLLRPHEPNLFRYLKESGYDVIALGKNDVFDPESCALSLTSWKSNTGGNAGPNPYAFGDPRYYSFLATPFPHGIEETADMKNVMDACRILSDRKPEDPPLFLFLPLTLPHPAYGPPEPFYSMYDPDDLPPLRPPRTDTVPAFHHETRRRRGLDALDADFFRKINAVYLGMNEYVDLMLGRIINAIDESTIAGETVLIASSDHGDFAGDYGLVEKIHNAHYDVLTRVPLLFRGSGIASGHAVAEPVELFDIAATVSEIAGVAMPHTNFACSLVPQLAGAAGDPDRAVFTENGFRVDEQHCFEGAYRDDPRFAGTWDPRGSYYPQTMQHQEAPETMDRTVTIRTCTEKLIYRPRGVSEFYDLIEDPLETRNLFADRAESVQTLMNRLLSWYALTSDTVPVHPDPRGWPD